MLNIDMTPKITPEQFLFWLRGFLEAHPDPHVAADRIAAKMKEVQTTQPQWPWTLNVPTYSTVSGSSPGYGLGPNDTLFSGNPPKPVFFGGTHVGNL